MNPNEYKVYEFSTETSRGWAGIIIATILITIGLITGNLPATIVGTLALIYGNTRTAYAHGMRAMYEIQNDVTVKDFYLTAEDTEGPTP